MAWLVMVGFVVLFAIAVERGWYWYDEAIDRGREVHRLRQLLREAREKEEAA